MTGLQRELHEVNAPDVDRMRLQTLRFFFFCFHFCTHLAFAIMNWWIIFLSIAVRTICHPIPNCN
jgi:hypothetical protein